MFWLWLLLLLFVFFKNLSNLYFLLGSIFIFWDFISENNILFIISLTNSSVNWSLFPYILLNLFLDFNSLESLDSLDSSFEYLFSLVLSLLSFIILIKGIFIFLFSALNIFSLSLFFFSSFISLISIFCSSFFSIIL